MSRTQAKSSDSCWIFIHVEPILATVGNFFSVHFHCVYFCLFRIFIIFTNHRSFRYHSRWIIHNMVIMIVSEISSHWNNETGLYLVEREKNSFLLFCSSSRTFIICWIIFVLLFWDFWKFILNFDYFWFGLAYHFIEEDEKMYKHNCERNGKRLSWWYNWILKAITVTDWQL